MWLFLHVVFASKKILIAIDNIPPVFLLVLLLINEIIMLTQTPDTFFSFSRRELIKKNSDIIFTINSYCFFSGTNTF